MDYAPQLENQNAYSDKRKIEKFLTEPSRP